MPEHPSDDPSPAGPSPCHATPEPTAPQNASDRTDRYDANIRLIRRRLADESRMSKGRKWWLGR
jgi:hypothetical protein